MLPDDTRRLLQLAAAEPVGDPVLMWRAAERLGAQATTLAAEAGLVGTARVRFRHPLVRSAAGVAPGGTRCIAPWPRPPTRA